METMATIIATDQKPSTSGKKVRLGKVISAAMNKSIIVAIERQVAHPLYKKYYKQTKKVMAHDEGNECRVGDIVRVIESRPLSARKRWMLADVIERAQKYRNT